MLKSCKYAHYGEFTYIILKKVGCYVSPTVNKRREDSYLLAQSGSSSLFALQVNSGQSSLLGEPPKEVRLPSNPYLNLASVMPGVVLQGEHPTRAHLSASLK